MSECPNGSACEAYDRRSSTAGDVPPGSAPWCADCLQATRRDIGALPLDYRDLAQLTPGIGVATEARVSGTFEPGAPIDLHAEALRADIAWQLGVWEPPVREAAGLPPAPEHAVRPGWLVGRAASVLQSHVATFVGLGPTWGYLDGPEAPCVELSGSYGAAALRLLHIRATAALGLTRSAVRVPGPCGRCGLSTLEREPGSDRVRCRFCGLWISADDYAAYVGMALMGSAMPR